MLHAGASAWSDPVTGWNALSGEGTYTLVVTATDADGVASSERKRVTLR